MLKVGMANLEKAKSFHQQQNWAQTLRYGELAATKLKQLKDRRLETVQIINDALMCKFDALLRLDRHREALECIKECYTMWAMNHLRNPGSMHAAFGLIHSCMHNKEYEDAERYARHAYFMIAEMTDNFIPVDQRPPFIARASRYLAMAIYQSVQGGGSPAEGKQKAGEEAITFARKALELHTQFHGIDSAEVADCLGTLADVSDFFNDVDDDEVLRLRQQAIALYRRVEGSSSLNVAAYEHNSGHTYFNRSGRAQAANDLDREMANLELALPHYREAGRIYRAVNHIDSADDVLRKIAEIEEIMRQLDVEAATAAAATSKG